MKSLSPILVSLCLLGTTLPAMTLSEVVDASLAKSPSLEVIHARLQANKQSIDVSNQFTNPEVSLTTNSIDSSQAMSQTVVTLKQKIEFYNKRDTRQAVPKAQEELLKEELYLAKVALVSKIKQEAYTIWELREQKNIIKEYITLTKKNIELFESYTRVSDNQHIGIMKAELSLADLDITLSTLNANVYAAYARLSYLSATQVKSLEIDLSIHEKPDLQQMKKKLQFNPSIAVKSKEIQKQNTVVEVADINNYPDLNLLAGYAYRENFDNYFTFGVALSLPIYGTEDAQEEEAKALTLALVSQKSDLEISIESMLKVYYAQMLSSYTIYHIVQDDALPQVAHMFDLSSSSIATGGDLFKYIDVLFDKLKLEQRSITAVATYNKNEAKISELAGEIQ